MEEKKYDLRVLEQNLRKGVTKKEDYQKFLKSLPDESANAEYIQIPEDSVSPSDPTQPEGDLTFSPVAQR